MSESDKHSVDQWILQHWSDIDQAKRFDKEVNRHSMNAENINAPSEQLTTFSDYCAELRG